MRGGWYGIALAWTPLVLLIAVGCGQEPAPEPDFVHDEAVRGPLKLVVEARPKQVWLGDPIKIAVSLHTPDDYVAQLPTADELGELEVRSEDAPDPRPAPEGGLDWRRTFTVESYASGTIEIPPLVAKYAHRPTEAGVEPTFDSELVTGTLKIEVRSALTTQDSTERPRDITGTLMPELSFWRRPAVWWAAGLIGVIVAGVLVVVLLARKLSGRGPAPVRPEIWALQMLAALETEDWLGTGRAKELYYRLSEVVRAYIEKKFALAAPEMTTEEFLVTLARDRSALPYDADRLRAFLEACDIVKYAAFNPQDEDAQQAMRTARAFIHETAAAAERAAQRMSAAMTGAESEGRAA